MFELLLHYLLQYLQRQLLGLQKGDLLGRCQLSNMLMQRDDYLVPLVLKLALCSL